MEHMILVMIQVNSMCFLTFSVSELMTLTYLFMSQYNDTPSQIGQHLLYNETSKLNEPSHGHATIVEVANPVFTDLTSHIILDVRPFLFSVRASR